MTRGTNGGGVAWVLIATLLVASGIKFLAALGDYSLGWYYAVPAGAAVTVTGTVLLWSRRGRR